MTEKKNVGAHRWSFIYEYIFCKCFPHKMVDVVFFFFFCACDRFKSESHCQSHRMTHLKNLGCIISAPGHRNSSCQCQWVADPLMPDAAWLCHLTCLVFRGKTASCNYLLHQICFLVYIPETISFCLGIIFSHMWTQCITTRKFHLSACLKNRMTEQVCVWERYEILGMCLYVCVCLGRTFSICLVYIAILHYTLPLHQAGNKQYLGCWKLAIKSHSEQLLHWKQHTDHILDIDNDMSDLLLGLLYNAHLSSLIPHTTPHTVCKAKNFELSPGEAFLLSLIRKFFSLNTLSSFQHKTLHFSLSIIIVWLTHNAICTDVFPYSAEHEMCTDKSQMVPFSLGMFHPCLPEKNFKVSLVTGQFSHFVPLKWTQRRSCSAVFGSRL